MRVGKNARFKIDMEIAILCGSQRGYPVAVGKRVA